ncbi:MAG: class I SAM-dependent methyltransferase [Chloroflexi bacterium]|nr:class I SAM-dependent methyltransferase [Chloroflexota bacterium]MDA1296937.1 class I SAM-dependent methyltransferase [Chloroflexota bacterium]
MPTKTPVAKAEQLIRPKLDESYDPQSLIALVPIHTDQVVADVGSGPGWLSIPLAKYLYGGKLYAVDIQEGMLQKLAERAAGFRMYNIETVLSKESSIPLDDDIVDGLVLSGTLNEATRAKSLFKDCVRLLRKSGWLAVVEWLPVEDDQEIGPPAKQRLSMDTVIEMGAELGLTKVRSRPIGNAHFVVVFKK